MKTNNVVTIWHYGGLNTPVSKIFKNVHVDTVREIDKNGIKQRGFFEANSTIVRIPTKEEISVLPGDYLFVGESYSAFPDSEDSFKILEVKDNRRGGQKHWRIICGG